MFPGVNNCCDIVINDSGDIFFAAWAGSAGYRVAKCNSFGDTLWTAPCEGQLEGIILDKTGNVIVTGSTRGIGGQFDYLTVKYGDVTGVSDDSTYYLMPQVFTLLQNYPNPFNNTTRIEYKLPRKEYVSLRIYTVLGKEVAKLVEEFEEPGIHSVDFDGSLFPSGIYLYKLKTINWAQTKKVLLVK